MSHNSEDEEMFQITAIKRARNYILNGIEDPKTYPDDEDYIDFEHEHAMEFFNFAANLLGLDGPVTIDCNAYKHAFGLYSKDEMKELYPDATEESDIITIGTKGNNITLQDLRDFFSNILNCTWCDGRSYWLNGIYNQWEDKWVKRMTTADYYINWDS